MLLHPSLKNLPRTEPTRARAGRMNLAAITDDIGKNLLLYRSASRLLDERSFDLMRIDEARMTAVVEELGGYVVSDSPGMWY